ncbi:hypothetical protein DV736_g6691, partial [Chaetothyriales sp. CBS 134916]
MLTRAHARRKLPHESEWNAIDGPLAREDNPATADEVEAAMPADPQERNIESNSSPESHVLEDLEAQIREFQSSDPFVKNRTWENYEDGKVIKNRPYNGHWSIDSRGLVRRNGKIYINDPAIRAEIIRVNHDDPWSGGHFSEHTREVIKRLYWWPKQKDEINEYIRTCDVCQRMKVPRQKPAGLLAPLPPPTRPWQAIAMDFIVGLPPSKYRDKVYDSILVVVDRYSKMVCLIPCTQDATAEDLADMLQDEVFKRYGFPLSIVSDRGSLFISLYWTTFCYYLRIKRKLSTAFHPQTDGQTERMNQQLECYIRCYLNDEQSNWTSLLSAAEFAINSSYNSTIKSIPFRVAYNFIPRDGQNTDEAETTADSAGKNARSVNARAEERAKVHKQVEKHLAEAWASAQAKVKAQYDKHHRDVVYAPGEWVLLSSKNIKLKKAMKKLSDRYIGPFQVLQRIGQNAYRLKLPSRYGKLNPTFHVSLLKKWYPREGEPPPEPIDIDGDEVFIIEDVLDIVGRGNKRKLLIKWKGYSSDHNSWEPIANVLDPDYWTAEYSRKKQRDDNTNRTRNE